MNRPVLFADTGYWLALTNADDQLHERAHVLATTIPSRLVTTEAILLEIGDALANQRFRVLAIALIADIRSDPDIEVISLSQELFETGFRLYAERADKGWSLTDCVSCVVMGERGIREALAADQHFIQAGFRALLLE